MTAPPEDGLLDRLSRGDADAADAVFRKYEPFLRRLVRRLLRPRLRSKFDSADVVQSVWTDLIAGFQVGRWRFADEARLRAFLVRMTRNRFLDRYRQARTALERERPLAGFASWRLPEAPAARPSENARAVEVWERLLALCPPEHQEVLQLRRLGLSRAEIAGRTGLHEGSVRRILRGLARRVAFPGSPEAAG